MILEWTIFFAILIPAAFLFGLCAVMFRFYSAKKRRYRMYIALMSIAEVSMTGVILLQLLGRPFGYRPNVWIVVAMVELALILKIGGLFRMFRHRNDEARLKE